MQQKGIYRFRTHAEEGMQRVGELSFVNQQEISFVPIAHFDITETQDLPHFHPEIGKRLLSTLEKGSVSFPSFGASVSLERLVSKSFDPPNTLFIAWESAEIKNLSVSFPLTVYPQSFCASLFFERTYELLPKAYQTLLSFIEKNNMEPCGDSLEINHLDAFSVSDSAHFITRVLIPVTKSNERRN